MSSHTKELLPSLHIVCGLQLSAILINDVLAIASLLYVPSGHNSHCTTSPEVVHIMGYVPANYFIIHFINEHNLVAN